MSNCVVCNKILSRRTKGDRCINCYRNRNNTSETDAISKDESPMDHVENPNLNSSHVLPLYNDNEIDNRAVINLLKQNMLDERIRDAELIDILKGQIDFLKDELIIKNEIIDRLLNTLTEKSSHSSSDNNTFMTMDRLDDSLSNISNVSLSDTVFSTKGINNNYDRQIANYRHKRHTHFNAKTSECNTPQNDSSRVHKSSDNQFASWEMHSKGFGSKMLKKMGYGGKGLGKSGEGIIHPVAIMKKNKFNPTENNPEPNASDDVHIWPLGTTLITGSSIISGIQENRLKNYRAKVRPFSGAKTKDMYHYLKPLLMKKPTNIILQIGSNDSPYKLYDKIANEMSALKSYINDVLPETKVFLSCPVIRTDNYNANKTLRNLDAYLRNNISDIVINDNIDVSCLGKRGLHLNPKGSGRLAMNFISLMQRL